MPPNNQPAHILRLQIGHGSDPGRQRSLNEDCYGIAASRALARALPRGYWHVVDKRLLAERGQLFVVADGIGGHNAGELASELAVKTILHEYYRLPFVEPGASLRQAISAANREILARSQADDQAVRDMGTTVTALVVRGNQATVAHLGDSRCYLIGQDIISQPTQDHTWVGEQIQAGVLTEEDAQRHPYRHVLSRSLGRGDATPDVLTLEVATGDRLVLCSDGLSNQVEPHELSSIVLQHPPAMAVDQLLDLANLRGGPDNITAVIVQYAQSAVPTGGSVLMGASARLAGPPRLWLAAGTLAFAALACVVLFALSPIIDMGRRDAPTPTKTLMPLGAAQNTTPEPATTSAAIPTEVAPNPTEIAVSVESPIPTEMMFSPSGSQVELSTPAREAFINVQGGGGTFIYSDPNDDKSGLVRVTQGMPLRVIGEQVTGLTAYGSDKYYQVEATVGGKDYRGYVSVPLVRLRNP